MEKNLCSFRDIAGGKCGADPRDSTNKCEVVKLQSCLKDIREHKRQYRIYGVETEIELILARANIFDQPRNLENLCICPGHRAVLGLGWRRTNLKCAIPDVVASHKKSAKKPKLERGLGKPAARTLWVEFGIFLPLGSGEFAAPVYCSFFYSSG